MGYNGEGGHRVRCHENREGIRLSEGSGYSMLHQKQEIVMNNFVCGRDVFVSITGGLRYRW